MGRAGRMPVEGLDEASASSIRTEVDLSVSISQRFHEQRKRCGRLAPACLRRGELSLDTDMPSSATVRKALRSASSSRRIREFLIWRRWRTGNLREGEVTAGERGPACRPAGDAAGLEEEAR